MARVRSIDKLNAALGPEYTIKTIDLEECLYRDFGNGFNVEISGCSDGRSKRGATLYLWFGDTMFNCVIVETISNVNRTADDIDAACEELYEYSESLIAQGYADRDSLYALKNNR